MSTPIPPQVENYLRMVEADEPRACKDQHALASYLRRVFETEDLVVDTQLIANYLRLEKYFPFSRLYPWEECLLVLWNCVFTQDGLPRWPDVLAMLGRGSGKDGFIAFDAFCMVSPYNPIHDYNVDICAYNEDQAMQPVQDVVRALERPGYESKLNKFYAHTQETVRGRKNGGAINGRTNNPKGRNGLRSGKIYFNEVHLYENYNNIKVFTAGLGKVAHPRRGIFTSNGHTSDGPLDDYLAQAKRILFEGEVDGGFLPFVFRLDAEDEVHDEANWYKACPSLLYRDSLLQETRKEYEGWLKNPVEHGDFMAMRMGLRTGFSEISVTDYEKVLETKKDLPDMTRWSCIAGVDYAELSDWASVVLHFRRGNDRFDLHHSWICAQSKTLPLIHAPWQTWAQDGEVTVVDDVSISPDLLAAYVQEAGRRYNVKMLSMDHFRWTLVAESFRRIGFDATDRDRVHLVRPSDIMQTDPVIQECFNRGYFHWGDSPPLRWAVNNTKRVRASKKLGADTGNYYYAKIEGKSRKTDPFMALVAAMTVEDRLGAGTAVRPPMAAVTW